MNISREGLRALSDSDFAAVMIAMRAREKREDELTAAAAAVATTTRASETTTTTTEVSMKGIRFAGRMFRQPRVTVTARDTDIVIRVDDEIDDEQWAEICIVSEALAELLASICVQRPDYHPATLGILTSLGWNPPT